MKLPLQMKRPGATAAGIFSLALGSVVLLCGAGSVPVENFSPQGPMQADLNAGGHNLTNIATVSATNVMVSGTLTAANLGSAATNAASAFAPAAGPFPWTDVSGAPAIQSPITLTTSGSSGAATFSGNTLNIPNYGAAGVASFDSRTGAVTLQAGDLAISGASLTALPANASLYPTLNQNTTGTASFAMTSGTATFAAGSGTATALTGTITGAQITTNGSGGYQAYTVPANSVMLVLGDSISTGYGGAGTSACWEYYLSKQLPSLDIYSFGIVGSTSGPVSNASSGLYLLSQGSGLYTKWSNGTVTTASGSFASILANYSGAKFGVAAYGANDALGVNGVTASTFQSNMASIYSSLNSLGCTVIGTSILPRAGSGTSTPAFAQHLYNSYVRELGPPYVTSGSSRWNLFADVGGVGGLTDFTDTTVFEGDQVHPNPMGHQIYANVVYRAITEQNITSTALSPLILSDQSGNVLLPYTGLSINSLTYPNATSGQILTVGTRGGTGTPFVVDNGSTTIAWLNNAGVLTLGSGTSVYGGIAINTPSNAGGASGSDIICGTRGSSANLFHGDNGSNATFNISSAGAISLCQGITTSGTLTVSTGSVLIPGATGTNTPGIAYKFQSGVGTGNTLVPSQIFIAGTPTASGTGAQTPGVAASFWPGGVYVGTGTTTDPALGTGNTGYMEGSVLALYAAQTTVAGSTSGTVTFSEPFQGASYKKVVAYMNGGFSGTATYTLPTVFTTTPLVVNSDSAVTTDGTGTIVVTAGGTLPRTVVLEGY